MGVFTAGGTPIDEQVPLQPVGVSCRWGSSWSDVVYYRWKKEGDRGDKAACCAGCASILGLLRPREKGSCSFFEVLGTIGSGSQWLNKTKREQNIIHPALLWGRSGAVTISRRAGSIDSGSPVSGTPLALALYGLVLSPAPRCGRCESYCCCRAGAEVEVAGRRPWRRADGGSAAGGKVEIAADRRCRTCQNASVCFCTAENCWKKSSTISPSGPAWEIGESKERCLSVSLISAKVSHRWHSWTTNVDIVCPRARAGTFVALKARSVAVRSSCISFRLLF